MTPKPFAFVLMPFSDPFRDTYLLGIKPACEEAGYYCERLDEQIFEETMLERIYNQIAKADLIVADLTERNPNVFYETGYAHALGRRVILLTRNSEDIPFDLKHHFHIVYSEGITDLKHRLRERAAYYASHPGSSTRNPFDQISLLLNGQLVDWSSERIAFSAPARWLNPGDEATQAVSIDAAFHLLDTAVDTELDIDVRLITRADFPRSGWEISRGSSQIYTSITMPDGCVMHKPLSAVRVSLGDPDKTVFDLYPDENVSAPTLYPMTLRLISSGLRRDLHLEVNAAAA
jgi:hypothetical protein